MIFELNTRPKHNAGSKNLEIAIDIKYQFDTSLSVLLCKSV